MNRQTNSTMGQQAVDFVNESRASVAGGIGEVADSLDQAASSLGNGAANLADKAKETLDSAADYVREYDVNAIVSSAKRYAKTNPIAMMLGALAVGFVAGQMLRRD